MQSVEGLENRDFDATIRMNDVLIDFFPRSRKFCVQTFMEKLKPVAGQDF